MHFKDYMNWCDIDKGLKEYAVILYCWYEDKTLQEVDDRGLSNDLLQLLTTKAQIKHCLPVQD